MILIIVMQGNKSIGFVMFFTHPQVESSVLQVTGTVIAGFETTGTSIAMALYMLATNPEVQAKAQKEVDDVLHGKVGVCSWYYH
jgi:hypothetical protein